MGAYSLQDRIESHAWDRHYQQIVREEMEKSVSDDLENQIKQRDIESLLVDKFIRVLGNSLAITKTFDDDVEFQERLAEFITYTAETIAHHHVTINFDNL